jgi:hypothetical protein
MSEKLYSELTLNELIARMHHYTVGDMRYDELRAELDRRQVLAQISASAAQVRASWWQFGAMVAMVLAAVATACIQLLAWVLPH